MRSCTQTHHVLEIRDDRSDWCPPVSGMYRPAVLLAYQGRIVEAIELAETIRIREYGDMHGIAFRVLTTTKTVTVASGPFTDAMFDR